MANTDFSSSLERMKTLMTHGAGDSLNIKSNVSETVIKSTEGADGKTYGIVREAQKYYLKESADGGASFDYIGGIHEKHLNECPSYENATKKLELKIRGLNEDRNTGKVFETYKPVEQSEYIVEATSDMRKEINRQREIMMGAAKIMNETSEFINKPKFKDPEGFGTATDPKKQGEPFQETPEAYKGDIDPVSSKKTPKNAGEPFDKEAKSKEDKFDIEKTTKKQGFGEKAKDVLGNSVAAKTVSGGKVIKVTETQLKQARKLMSEGIFDDDNDYDDNEESDLLKSFNYDVDSMAGKRYNPTKNDLNDFQDEPEETFDQPFEEGEIEEGFMDNVKAGFNAAKSVGSKAVDAAKNMGTNIKNTASQGYNQSMQNSSAGNVQKIATQLKTELDNLNARTVKAGGQPLNMNSVIAALSNQLRGTKGVDTSRYRTENVDEDSNEKLVNKITEAVLNVFGKAPNYQKPAFTTPTSNGSLVDGTTEWDDESAKGDKPYGQKIGDSAPFTEPVKQKIGEGEIGEDADAVQQGKTQQAKPNLGKEGDKAPFDKAVQKNGDKIGKGNAVQQGETQQAKPNLGKEGDKAPFDKQIKKTGGLNEISGRLANRASDVAYEKGNALANKRDSIGANIKHRQYNTFDKYVNPELLRYAESNGISIKAKGGVNIITLPAVNGGFVKINVEKDGDYEFSEGTLSGIPSDKQRVISNLIKKIKTDLSKPVGGQQTMSMGESTKKTDFINKLAESIIADLKKITTEGVKLKVPAPQQPAPSIAPIPTSTPPQAPMPGEEEMPPMGDMGGEQPDMGQPEGDTNAFGKEKFDAGIDVDENVDPKNYIEKLTGKLAQKLRDFNGTQDDVDLNKFVINSLIPAAIPQMDDNEAKDVIKKVQDNIGKSGQGTEQSLGDENSPEIEAPNQEPEQGQPFPQEESKDFEIDDLINEILSGKSVKRNVQNKNPFKGKKFK